MVEVSPKNAQSYLGIYQNLLERVKKLDELGDFDDAISDSFPSK